MFLFLFSSLTNIHAGNSQGRDKGPFYGESLYLPYSIYLQGPASRGKALGLNKLQLSSSLYYLNDNKTVREYNEYNQKVYRQIRDYESLTAEIQLSYSPIYKWEFSTIMRLQGFYGGCLDELIEWFHSLFNFPNGGREYIPQNDVAVDIQNDNGVTLELDHTVWGLGDMELWVRYTFLSRRWIDLAGSLGFKAPLGPISGESVLSSGYPDIHLALLADLYSGKLFSFYIQGGLTIPFDSFLDGESSPYPFAAGLLAVEFHPVKSFSLMVQMNIKSPSLSGGTKHWLYTDIDYLDLPQMNLLVGVVFKQKRFRLQFYFEEDTVTNQGNDILFNLHFTYTFSPFNS